jgi:hypothetical protein
MRLSGFGLSVDLPFGWTGQIFRNDSDAGEGELTAPVMQVGNYALPTDSSTYGTRSTMDMMAGQVFLVVRETNPEVVARSPLFSHGAPQLVIDDFSPSVLAYWVPGQMGVQKGFWEQERAFLIYAVLAQQEDMRLQLEELNAVLSSLVVTPGDYLFRRELTSIRPR